MGKAHEVAVGADAKPFDEAIRRNIIKPLEAAEKALDKLGDTDAGRDAARDLDKLEDSLKDAQRQSEKTERAVSDIGNATVDLDRLGRKGEEIGGELRQNLGETFSSFRGDLEDLPQIAQDTLGGLAGSGALGGIPGLAATAAGAAGIGLIIAAMEGVREQQALSEESIAGWADAYLESGGRVISAAQVVGSVVAQSTDPELFKVASQNAENWGVDVTTAMRAIAGDASALSVVQGSVNAMQDEWTAIVGKGGDSADDYAAKTLKLTGEQVKLRDQLFAGSGAFKQLTGEMEAGRERAGFVSEALKGVINDAGGASKEVDELGNALYTLPDGTQVMVSADTGLATQNVDKFKGDLDGIPEKVTSVIAVDLSQLENAHRQVDALKRKADAGITVSMKTVNGRQLL